MAVFKAAFLADIHYYSPKLGTTGRAYELRSGSDQKCLAESGAVVDAAFDILANSDADCVCIAGDLTNNGDPLFVRKESLQINGDHAVTKEACAQARPARIMMRTFRR